MIVRLQMDMIKVQKQIFVVLHLINISQAKENNDGSKSGV